MSTNTRNLLLAACAAGFLSACGGSAQPPAAATDTREADLQQREADLAAREAALADQQAAQAPATATPAPAAPAPVVASKPAAKPAPKPVATKPASSTPVAAPRPRVVTVPAGTRLDMTLSSDITTKTAQVGDRVRARLARDVMVDGRVALAQGTVVSGQVSQVVSGSKKIGGLPTLALRFDQIEQSGGASLPVNGEITQTGRSDTAADTAKIAGGAAAGAVIGNQLGHGDGNKVIGGIIGGALGAVAAKKTGAEVELAAGASLSFPLSSALEVSLR